MAKEPTRGDIWGEEIKGDDFHCFRNTMKMISRQKLEGKYYNISIIAMLISWGVLGFWITLIKEAHLPLVISIILSPVSAAIVWIFLAIIPSWIQWVLKGLQLFKRSGCRWVNWTGGPLDTNFTFISNHHPLPNVSGSLRAKKAALEGEIVELEDELKWVREELAKHGDTEKI